MADHLTKGGLRGTAIQQIAHAGGCAGAATFERALTELTEYRRALHEEYGKGKVRRLVMKTMAYIEGISDEKLSNLQTALLAGLGLLSRQRR